MSHWGTLFKMKIHLTISINIFQNQVPTSFASFFFHKCSKPCLNLIFQLPSPSLNRSKGQPFYSWKSHQYLWIYWQDWLAQVAIRFLRPDYPSLVTLTKFDYLFFFSYRDYLDCVVSRIQPSLENAFSFRIRVDISNQYQG